MQRLLEYFRDKEDDQKLVLATPESQDAADTYVAALGRSNQILGSMFGPQSRLWAVAMLVTQWCVDIPSPASSPNGSTITSDVAMTSTSPP